MIPDAETILEILKVGGVAFFIILMIGFGYKVLWNAYQGALKQKDKAYEGMSRDRIENIKLAQSMLATMAKDVEATEALKKAMVDADDKNDKRFKTLDGKLNDLQKILDAIAPRQAIHIAQNDRKENP